ncbi:LacI family transcriptional regulator [Prosthecobacter fusiformis]|uniref:LacI family transcriptional regulator n=1 Tax=Prosthecobacter fusiformis TaxID=48464 RepID=A0A4R7RNA4_9BACT|nr:LacI family DNA-binding transcriptional regulator [Prosthecobacter fusiformis]TDU66489.1 LacI family transcriptional regulator [Prosthecobacter fusiformis]
MSVTLQQIAQAAGVSSMTVSRVMHHSPRVSAATRERVQQAIEALGYQPDPHLARMMTMVRGRKKSRVRAVIAVIRETVPEDALQKTVYQYVPIEAIRRRAEQHGYHAEEFWLGRDGLDAVRLGSILRARGIEGIIVSPQSSQMLCAQLDYTPFAAATFGFGLTNPSLHRAAGNMNLGIQLAVRELRARGYQRIGLAVTQWVDHRAEGSYSGAMLHVQQSIPVAQRVPVLLFPHNEFSRCRKVFIDWMKTEQPDALITFDQHIPEWLQSLGLRVPEDIGLVVHDWTPAMKSYAGIHQRRDHVAAAGVDLVATQLLQNECGVPEVPRQILIPPEWIEGPSVRARAA